MTESTLCKLSQVTPSKYSLKWQLSFFLSYSKHRTRTFLKVERVLLKLLMWGRSVGRCTKNESQQPSSPIKCSRAHHHTASAHNSPFPSALIDLCRVLGTCWGYWDGQQTAPWPQVAQSPVENTDTEDKDTLQSSAISYIEQRKPYWIMVSAQVLELHSLALTPDLVSHVKTWTGGFTSPKA